MAIAFARARYISRSNGGSATRSAAYTSRSKIYDERTGLTYSFQDQGTLKHHEILLPGHADPKFLDAGSLWNAAEAQERRKDSQVAREIVLALPGDPEISDADRVELARSFVRENFTSKDLAVQLDVHGPDNNPHAHLLISTRTLGAEGFASHKFIDTDVKAIRGRPIVTAAYDWGKLWEKHQNSYFKHHKKGIEVDPTAPAPGLHMGPLRFRNPRDPRYAKVAAIKKVNAMIARDPKATAEHLSYQKRFDGAAVAKFLAKHVADPKERESIERQSLSELGALQRGALEKAALTDKVMLSGIIKRDLTLDDVVRELSPEYVSQLAKIPALRKEIRFIDKTILPSRRGDMAESKRYVNHRWRQMSATRKVLHALHVHRDFNIRMYEGWGRGNERGSDRQSIRRGAAQGELDMATRLAAKALADITPRAH